LVLEIVLPFREMRRDANGLRKSEAMPQPQFFRVSRCVAALLPIAFGWLGPAGAAPLDAFTGSFRASGMVADGPDATRHSVRCNFTIQHQGVDRVSLEGTCWAYLIFSRSISADVALNPQSGRLTGTYTEVSNGTSRLDGRLEGATIVVIINWPKPVYGDLTANLRVFSLGRDRLQFIVTDRFGADRQMRVTTDLTLTRQ